MGVKNLSSLFKDSPIEVRKSITIPELGDRILALDAFNQIFQFLSSIRDQTGKSLQSQEGEITAHLVGILTRNSVLLQNGITPVYVFDGESHPLKKREKERRRELTKLAEIEYKKALKEGDLVRAKSFAQRTNKLTGNMIDDSKKLLDTMGIPWIQAPGEGEAQAAQMSKEGLVWATASQDYDAILFGSPRLVRNLNLSGKRSLPSGRVIEIKPETIELDPLLDALNLTRNQLIDLGILLGTDFNPDGFKGVGVKTANKWIQKYGDFETILKNESKIQEVDTPYEEIRKIFLEPNVTKKVKIDLNKEYNPEMIKSFLMGERSFSEDRYGRTIDKTFKLIKERKAQSSLDEWF